MGAQDKMKESANWGGSRSSEQGKNLGSQALQQKPQQGQNPSSNKPQGNKTGQ